MTLVEFDGLAARGMDEAARFSRANLKAAKASQIHGLAPHQRSAHRPEQSTLDLSGEIFQIDVGPFGRVRLGHRTCGGDKAPFLFG